MRKEFGVKRLTKEHRIKARKILQQEVETYNDYVSGNVYGYTITQDGGDELDLDSCWGFFGDYKEYLMTEAREVIDHRIEQDQKHIERMIKEESLELQFA